jgi:hypothetical protein
MRGDAVPETILCREHSRPQTVELCGDVREGFRCTLTKDHAGMHECLGLRGPLQWIDDESARA